MQEQAPTIEAIARPLIEHCRRDIAAAALQLEAARAILISSRWLVTRWEERRRQDAITGGIHLPDYDTRRASGFIEIEEPRTHRRRRRGALQRAS